MSEEPGNLRVLKALLDAGASPDIKDEEEATPLALVTVWSEPEGKARLLLAAGADPLAADSVRWTGRAFVAAIGRAA